MGRFAPCFGVGREVGDATGGNSRLAIKYTSPMLSEKVPRQLNVFQALAPTINSMPAYRHGPRVTPLVRTNIFDHFGRKCKDRLAYTY